MMKFLPFFRPSELWGFLRSNLFSCLYGIGNVGRDYILSVLSFMRTWLSVPVICEEKVAPDMLNVLCNVD